uniref:beta-1,3-galactosyltransferase 2-like n=2 Tax=Myxine glutinosa TaxID=7769 RepID=UPI00358E21C0
MANLRINRRKHCRFQFICYLCLVCILAVVSVLFLNAQRARTIAALKTFNDFSLVQGREHSFQMNEPDLCFTQNPFLLLLVFTAPDEGEVRDAIRETWGGVHSVVWSPNGDRVNVTSMFLIGMVAASDSEAVTKQAAVLLESQRKHDVVQYTEVDTFDTLTFKTLAGMIWAHRHCQQAKYIMKSEGDVFVNIEYLVKVLLQPGQPAHTDYLTGSLVKGGRPQRDPKNKWFIPFDVYPDRIYPPFALTSAYVLSADLAPKILNASQYLPHFKLADVYLGMCLARLALKPIAPPEAHMFNSWFVVYNTCDYAHIASSKGFSPQKLRYYWPKFMKEKIYCKYLNKAG